MKRWLIVFAVMLMLVTTSWAQKPEKGKYVAESLSAFIPKGYIIANNASVDLNADSLPDKLLVIEVDPDLDSIELTKLSDAKVDVTARPVILLIRQKNGLLKQVKRNDYIIQYEAYWAGSITRVDPFSGSNAGTGRFSFGFASRGGGQNCERTITFSYNRKADDWYLTQIVNMCSDENPSGEPYWGPPKEAGRRTPKEFGLVSFSEYNYDKPY